MDTSKRSNSVKKVIFIVLNVFFYAFIVLMLFFAIANIKVKRVDDIPNIFGRGFLSVQSDSMKGDNKDSFDEYALIFVDIVDVEEVKKLEPGAIITFYDYDLKDFNTHRIIVKGTDFFITQGDKAYANPETRYDPESNDNDPETFEAVSFNQVKAVYVSHWNGAGRTYDFIVDNFEWTIVVPVALIVILEVVLLVRNIVILNNAKLKEKYEKSKAEDLSNLEAAKELMRKQILEELKKEQEQKASEN
jgi:signal peptidase